MNSQYRMVKRANGYIKDSIRIMDMKYIRMELKDISVQLKYV